MKVLTVINSILLAVLIGYGVYKVRSEKTRLAYINNGELYSGVKLTKDLETNYKALEANRQQVLDSLLTELKLTDSKDREKFLRVQDAYNKRRSIYTDELGRFQKGAQEKVANQLNEYIKNYAEENNLAFLFGANGSGNIWYAQGVNDVTKSVIDYVNSKYDNKK